MEPSDAGAHRAAAIRIRRKSYDEKKTTLSLSLAAAMAGSLVACGGSQTGETTAAPAADTKAETEAAAETEAPAEGTRF